MVEESKNGTGHVASEPSKRISGGSRYPIGKGPKITSGEWLTHGDTSNRSDMGGISAALFVSFPLLDGGRLMAETSQAIAMKGRAHANFLQSELMVEKEVRQAWLDLQTAGANIASSEPACDLQNRLTKSLN